MKDESVLETQPAAFSSQHSSAGRDTEQSAEIGVAVSVHLYPLGSGMAGPRTSHVRSHDASTCCRASLPAYKPRRRSRKVAEMAVCRAYFEHPYTGVDGVGKCDGNIRGLSSAIPPSVAHLCSLQERSDDSRHVAAPAVHRVILTPRLIIHD
jgi:hypothetical protein